MTENQYIAALEALRVADSESFGSTYQRNALMRAQACATLAVAQELKQITDGLRMLERP